jgi:hypothetical protein
MKLASKDISAFLAAHARATPIEHPDGTPGYNPYPLLFDHYFFLEVGWSPEEDRAVVAYRPLFRVVANHTRHAPDVRWRHAIEPLCRAGGEKDLPLLHEEYQSRREGAGRKVYQRQQLLLGMGRILGISLPAWRNEDFPDHEPEQYAKVRAALEKKGLLD